MMMKKNMANMQKSLAAVKERLAGAAGRPGLGSMGSKPPSQVQQMFPRNPSGMQFNQSPPQTMQFDKPPPQLMQSNQSPPQTMQFNQSPPPKMTQGMYGMDNSGSGMYGMGSNLQPQQQMPSGMITNKMKKGGNVKPKNIMDGGMAYSKGGSASSRADGIARKGKTKGKMV